MNDVSKDLFVFLAASDNKKLKIPPYQRNYSWDQKQFNDLWSDILSLRESSTETHHFMGLLVLIDQKDHVEVVDGQQRLTSLFILYITLRDSILELSRDKDPVSVFNYNRQYLELNEIIFNDHQSVLTPNRNDQDIYFELARDYTVSPELLKEFNEKSSGGFYMDSITFKQKRFKDLKFDFRSLKHNNHWKAYSYFYEQIQELLEECPDDESKLKELILFKNILNRQIKIIEFKSNDQNAFNLFETLNDRGMRLAAVDLIKNNFLRKFNANYKGLEDVADKWDSIFSIKGKISNSEHDLFLRHLHNSRQPFISKSTLFESYKNAINQKNTDKEREDYLEYLNTNADIFQQFKKLYSVDNKGNVTTFFEDIELLELFLLLKKSGSVQWYSLAFPLIAIYNAANSKKNIQLIQKIKTTLWLTVNLILRFQILEIRFNYLEKRIPRMARSLSIKVKFPIHEDVSEEQVAKLEVFNSVELALDYVILSLNEIIQDQVGINRLKSERVSENFNDPTIPNYNLIQELPILKTIMAKDFESNSLAYSLLRIYNLTKIESNASLLPFLSLEHVLPQKYQENWKESAAFAPRVVNQLGNMIMLKQELNSGLSNSNFETKKREYKSQHVQDHLGDYSFDKATDQNQWNEEFISRRTAKIIETVLTVLETTEFKRFNSFNSL